MATASASAAAALSQLAHGIMATASRVLTQPPPAVWDPTTVTIRRWTKRFQDVWAAQGFATAYNKLRMETQLRAGGQLMGTDANGNRCRRPQPCVTAPASRPSQPLASCHAAQRVRPACQPQRLPAPSARLPPQPLPPE
jgi:hypothetical protein